MALLKGAELYAPPLLAYELTSVARKKALKYPQLRGRISEALEIDLSLNINWTEVNRLEVLRLALETGLTTYDARPVPCARTRHPLVTFDERLAGKAKIKTRRRSTLPGISAQYHRRWGA